MYICMQKPVKRVQSNNFQTATVAGGMFVKTEELNKYENSNYVLI